MRELSLHILDVAENSLQAGASQLDIVVEEDLDADRLTITVCDNGQGMSAAQMARLSDPFFTTRTIRQVGLGVPFFKAAAEQCGGSLTVTSRPGAGTTLQAVFQHSHIDRAPLGDMVGTLMAILCSASRGASADGSPAPTCDLHYVHRVTTPGCRREHVLELDTAQIRAELGDVGLDHPAVRRWLQGYITEGEHTLHQVEGSDAQRSRVAESEQRPE